MVKSSLACSAKKLFKKKQETSEINSPQFDSYHATITLFSTFYTHIQNRVQLIRGNYIMQECKSREKTTFTGKVDENFRYE